jgi:ribosome-binding factor A
MVESITDQNEMRQFKRSQRLGQQILRDISQLLERELSELTRGMLTFTRVRLSDDLRYARIYYSFLGSPEDRSRVEEYLARHNGRIRSQIGQKLRVRNIPELTFKFDPSIEEGIRIEQLLNEIKNSESEQD